MKILCASVDHGGQYRQKGKTLSALISASGMMDLFSRHFISFVQKQCNEFSLWNIIKEEEEFSIF
jgi:hypothetical protein